MQKNDFNHSKFKELRMQAEEKIRENRADVSKTQDNLSMKQAQSFLHELQVYQEELEIQNEELLRTQLELERSRLHYFELYELAPAGYLTLDSGGIIREANLTASKLLGVERAKLLGEPFCHFIAREDHDIYYQQSRQVLLVSKQQTWEARLLQKGGVLFWAQVEMSASFDQNNQGPSTMQRLVIMDISKRKLAEAALQRANDELEQKVAERTAELARANEKYRLLVDNTPDLIFSCDLNLRHTFVNRRVCLYYGLEEQEIIGKTFWELGYSEDVARQLDELFVKVLNGNTVEEEISLPITGGAVRTFWFVVAPLFNVQGNVISITGTARDITERKNLEQEMVKADKLEAIGILAGGIAHDFNNYLAVLLSNINLAKLYGNRNDLSKILEKMEELEEATMRAKDLSNQLFTFARGGAPVKEKISLKEIITDDIKFALSGTPVYPHFYLAEDLPVVEADVGQLNQVLNNIVINAVQAMPEGGILKVRADKVVLTAANSNSSVSLPKGSYIKITISDQGNGIPEEYLKKIFDPFFTTKDKGRGLGLATSYSIIKKHGGHIGVESQIGVGTSFAIFLPAAAGKEKHHSSGSSIIKGTGKILFMDDEEDLLSATGESLSAFGYDVTLSRDGEQAIKLYACAMEQSQPFDLVVLDLTVPGGMGGKQTIKELLKLDPDIKAIVVSGYSNDPVIANYRDYGFKGMIKKPFTIEELSKTVSRVIR